MLFYVLLPALTLFYVGLMLRYGIGLRRVLKPDDDSASGHELPPVSVVIAARNEETNIGSCLEQVLANDYPDFEVIVVDDFSSDATADVVESIIRRSACGRARLVSLDDRMSENLAGKAGALEVGIAVSRGSIVLSTDADCHVGSRWIRAMMSAMRKGVDFVSGPVLFEPDRRWHSRLQAFEFLGLIAVGAGGIGSGAPNMCNSANIAYRRDVYDRLRHDLPAKSAPPDEVMLQLLHREDPESVAFCADVEAVVRTRPAESIREFVNQRRRWAGNGARYPSPWLMTSIVLVYAFYAVTLTAMIVAPFNISILLALIPVLTLKMLVEAGVTFPAARHFGQINLVGWLIPGQLLQIPYVVAVGFAGVVGEVDWKDRNAH